jgi:7-cyano-7-deazaguanine synthase
MFRLEILYLVVTHLFSFSFLIIYKIFLSYALAFAEVLKANAIFLGINAVDYSGRFQISKKVVINYFPTGYPDCRPEYIAAYEKMAQLATKTGVEHETLLKIHSPLMEMTKIDIVKKGLELGVEYPTIVIKVTIFFF